MDNRELLLEGLLKFGFIEVRNIVIHNNNELAQLLTADLSLRVVKSIKYQFDGKHFYPILGENGNLYPQ